MRDPYVSKKVITMQVQVLGIAVVVAQVVTHQPTDQEVQVRLPQGAGFFSPLSPIAQSAVRH